MKPRPKTKILALLLALCLALGGMPLNAWAGEETQNSGAEGNITAFAEVAGDVVAKNSDNTAAAPQFSDVAGSDSNLLYINYINAREIMAGFPDGSFRPEEGLTRAQAAVIISKAALLETDSPDDSSFKDVSPGHWAAGYIAAAVKAGYLRGMGEGSYLPDQPLSRAQAISLIMRLSDQEDSQADLPALEDMDEEHWAARSMAMAIDAGMIVPQNDNIRPDQDITRGDMSRALSILLTADPELSSLPLSGTLKVSLGEVEIKQVGQEAVTVSGSRQVGAGDTIETLSGTAAEINYPDGSSLLLEAGSVLTIKESAGRAYIKRNGQSGTAVDSLYLELQTGTMFGALSSLAIAGDKAIEAEKVAAARQPVNGLLAANTSRFDLWAAQEAPWYKSAHQEKVKVTVDMPWGVAAIRGSFWQNTVNSNGSGFMSLLEGNGTVTSGGQTVNLNPGQAASVSTPGQPPSAPAPMTAVQLSQWARQQSWVQNTFDNMTQNQGSPAPGTPAESNTAPAPAPSLEKALNQALEQAQKAADSMPRSSGGSGSSGNNGETTEITATIDIPWDIYLPQQVMNADTGLLEDNTAGLSYTLTCDVPGVELGVTEPYGGSKDHFEWHYDQANHKLTLIPISEGYASMVNFTLSKDGYTSWTSDTWFNVYVPPVIEPLNGYAVEGYAPFTVGIPSNWNGVSDSLLDSNGNYVHEGYTEGGIHRAPDFCNVTIASGLPAGLYYILRDDSSYSPALAPLLIRPAADAGNFFNLESVVMNRYNETVYESVYQGDSLSFIFDEGLDKDSLSLPLQAMLDASVNEVFNRDFADLELGSFVLAARYDGILTFSDPYTFDPSSQVIRASLTDNDTVLTLAFPRGAFNSLTTINSRSFWAAGSIRSTEGKWLDMNDEPVKPVMVKFDENIFSMSSSIQIWPSQAITAINEMNVRFWYSPGWNDSGIPGQVYYLQSDGTWQSGNKYAFPTNDSYGSRALTLPSNAVNNIPNEINYIYCDVQINGGEWLYSAGKLEKRED